MLDQIRWPETVGALGAVGSFVIALMTWWLYRTEALRKRPIIRAEVNPSGLHRYNVTDARSQLVLPLQFNIWNEGHVGSSLKDICPIYPDGYAVPTIESHHFKPEAIEAGAIIALRIGVDLGPLPIGLENVSYIVSSYSWADIKAHAQDRLEEFKATRVVLKFTNHDDIVLNIPEEAFTGPRSKVPFPAHAVNRG